MGEHYLRWHPPFAQACVRRSGRRRDWRNVVAELPEHEFAIPGQIVADAAILEVEHRLLPEPRLVVQCELLLLEES